MCNSHFSKLVLHPCHGAWWAIETLHKCVALLTTLGYTVFPFITSQEPKMANFHSGAIIVSVLELIQVQQSLFKACSPSMPWCMMSHWNTSYVCSTSHHIGLHRFAILPSSGTSTLMQKMWVCWNCSMCNSHSSKLVLHPCHGVWWAIETLHKCVGSTSHHIELHRFAILRPQ